MCHPAFVRKSIIISDVAQFSQCPQEPTPGQSLQPMSLGEGCTNYSWLPSCEVCPGIPVVLRASVGLVDCSWYFLLEVVCVRFVLRN